MRWGWKGKGMGAEQDARAKPKAMRQGTKWFTKILFLAQGSPGSREPRAETGALGKSWVSQETQQFTKKYFWPHGALGQWSWGKNEWAKHNILPKICFWWLQKREPKHRPTRSKGVENATIHLKRIFGCWETGSCPPISCDSTATPPGKVAMSPTWSPCLKNNTK